MNIKHKQRYVNIHQRQVELEVQVLDELQMIIFLYKPPILETKNSNLTTHKILQSM